MAILDSRDRTILYELDSNARHTNSDIAKKIGISKQLAGFRIKRLMSEGVISKFFTIFDISKLGYTVHKSFLRLQNMDEAREKEFLLYLKSHPDVVWLVECDGRYDLAVGIRAKNIEHLDKTLKEINSQFGAYISERHIATIIKGEYFTRTYLTERPHSRTTREAAFGAVPTPFSLDELDWIILHELGENARASSVEISSKTKTSAETVSERIRKLEKAQVIRGYNITPNESQYPFLHFKVLIGLKNIAEDKERLLLSYCREKEWIVYIVKALGPWEFEIDLEVKDARHLRSIMMDLKTKFKEIIKDYSVLSIYQLHKYNFCPSIPLEFN